MYRKIFFRYNKYIYWKKKNIASSLGRASALADHLFKQDRVLRPKVAMFVVDEGHNILKVSEKLTQGLDAKGCFWSEPRPKE